ncbi:MAG: chorismate lyase [Gammaproteobacteria bacterium]|nr:chorismate lyase [Gammaproteobacteria bacterium]
MRPLASGELIGLEVTGNTTLLAERDDNADLSFERVAMPSLAAERADWLLDESSLTRRLRAQAGGDFRVRVLGQGRRRLLPEECDLLKIPRRENAIVREVLLCCRGRPWVFARTVIPLATVRGPQWRLTRLRSRPLGEALFTDRRVTRGALTPVHVLPGQRLHRIVGPASENQALWGRRSLFWYPGNKPLLVTELFLPQMWRALAEVRRGD